MASLLQLHFLIVGGGIGGLSAAHTLALAGHRVTLLESKAEFGELGAGVQLGPNITRLLFHWGLEQEIDRLAVRPAGLCFRKGNTGEQIKYQVWGETLEKKCGAPLVHLHRADLHKILLGLIQSWPSVSVCLDAKVTAIDPKAPSLTLQSGETIYGDVVIAADGVYSRMYEHITGDSAPPKPTGVIIYRGLVPAELVLKDPDLRSLVDNPENTAWTGINHLVVTYVVSSKKFLNIVALRLDDGSTEDNKLPWAVDRMVSEFADAGFHPRILKVLSLAPSIIRWRLVDRCLIRPWVHPDGRVALLGDACHPLLPYTASGASMAIEDAAVLGKIFSHITSLEQIQPFLEAYQSLRLPRVTKAQSASRAVQKMFFPDVDIGSRYKSQQELGNKQTEPDEDKPYDPATMFGDDVHEQVVQWWQREGRVL